MEIMTFKTSLDSAANVEFPRYYRRAYVFVVSHSLQNQVPEIRYKFTSIFSSHAYFHVDHYTAELFYLHFVVFKEVNNCPSFGNYISHYKFES